MRDIPTISRIEVLKNRKEILKNPLPFHAKYFAKHGDTFRINLGKKNTWVFTRKPETIKYILQTNHKNYQKSVLQTDDLGKYVGRGLLTSNGQFWRKHRRMIQPSFHKKKLVGLLDIMLKSIKNELAVIEPNHEKDVLPLMGDLAFQVVAQSLFSTDDIRSRMQELKDITMDNQKMLIKEMRLPYLKWWFNVNGEIKRHLNMSESAKLLLDKIIQHRIDSKVEKDDLFDMLLNATYEDGTHMPRKQLIDEVLILFTAGHETTANALSFTLLLLAQNNSVQEKLFKEVDTIDFESENLLEQLTKLSYTKQCIEEAMRLYPPAYFFDRGSVAEDKIDGVDYKKDTVWLLSIYELHRLADFWEKPEIYYPERFSPERKKDFSNYYFPFGAGPRMCIGNNFAMYEMMMVIALLAKKFKFSTPTKEIEINPLITLRPKEAILKFIPR
jgi:cytochrome P450